MSEQLAVAIHGLGGRMGQALARVADADEHTRIVAKLSRDGSLAPVDGVGPSKDPGAAQVLIDFSHADAFDAALNCALARRIAFVSGTTGLSDAQQSALRDAAVQIPVLWSANFSLGIAVLTRLVRDVARALPDWQCEILEAHHRHKRDAPSGTALALGRAGADARDQDFPVVQCVDRSSRTTPRRNDEIGFGVLRAGDIVGEHSVWFAGEGERIELVHRAGDRDIFARGALAAARWLVTHDAGLFSLDDVVGLQRI